MSGWPKYCWSRSAIQGRVFRMIVSEYGFCSLVLNYLTILKVLKLARFFLNPARKWLSPGLLVVD